MDGSQRVLGVRPQCVRENKHTCGVVPAPFHEEKKSASPQGEAFALWVVLAQEESHATLMALSRELAQELIWEIFPVGASCHTPNLSGNASVTESSCTL